VLGAWAVRFVAYSALIISAAIVLVLADVANVWAILAVIGAVWLVAAAVEWLIWRGEQHGWARYDEGRWTAAPPPRAPEEPRPRRTLTLPRLSLRRTPPPAAVVEPPSPGTDAPAPPAEPEPMPPPAVPEPAPAPPEPPAAPEPEPPLPEPAPPEPVPAPDEPEPSPPEPDPVPEPEPQQPDVEPAPDGRAASAEPRKRRSRRPPKPGSRRDPEAVAEPPASGVEVPAPPSSPESAAPEPEPEPAPDPRSQSASPSPQPAVLVEPEPEPEVEADPGSENGHAVQALVAPARRPPVRPRPQLAPQPSRPPPVVSLPNRAPVPAVLVLLDDRRRDEPREWNVWDLDRLARDEARRSPERADELSFLLVSLRRFAEPGGLLPIEFDALVRESFGGLLDKLERA